MFNLLAVVGIATVISPVDTMPFEVLQRDWMVMFVLTLALLAMAYKANGGNGTLTRAKGISLILCYIAYNTYLGIGLEV